MCPSQLSPQRPILLERCLLYRPVPQSAGAVRLANTAQCLEIKGVVQKAPVPGDFDTAIEIINAGDVLAAGEVRAKRGVTLIAATAAAGSGILVVDGAVTVIEKGRIMLTADRDLTVAGSASVSADEGEIRMASGGG